MKNECIKIVRRIGMPETNSSSSHSVSISMEPTNLVSPGDKDWDIEITEDGILKIPGGKDFGWDYFKTNSILVKLQYLCGIYCDDIISDRGKKKIVRLKKILKRIFGVRDVEFLWITKFSEDLKTVENQEDAYYNCPTIDHNSHDIFEEITENERVIRAFLLSRDSWLYGGNDNSDSPEGFYGEKIAENRVTAIASIELGGKIGRVDWEINNFLDQVDRNPIRNTFFMEDEFGILGGIYYDIETKEWAESFNINNSLNGKLLTYFTHSFYKNNQKFYILFTNNDFNKTWIELKKKKFGDSFTEFNMNKEILVEETMKILKMGQDYMIFPITIKLLDYAEFEI